MKLKYLFIFVLSIWILDVTAKPSEAHEPSELIIYDVWIMPASEGTANLYMTIENRGDHTVNLIDVITSFSASVEEYIDGERADFERFAFVTGETTSFDAAGNTILISEFGDALEDVDAIALTLVFDMGEDISYEATIGAIVAQTPLAKEHELIVYNSWGRFGFSGEGSVSGAYLVIENQGEADDRLIEIQSDAVAYVEIHESSMSGDMMSMSPVEAIDIPAKTIVDLSEESDYHLMLIDLQRDLMIDEVITMTLIFESGTEVRLAVPIMMQPNHETHPSGESHD